MPITIQDLATDLGVGYDDVKAYVDQLVQLDGEDAVISDCSPAPHARGVWITELTDEAAATIRDQFAQKG